MRSRFNPLKEHSALRVCTNYCQGLMYSLLILFKPKIERLPYAWPAQVWLCLSLLPVADELGEWKAQLITGYFWGMACTLCRTNPLWIQGQNMQSAVQCHHKQNVKFLGTYRDRKPVSHWGGNGLFNCLPVSCKDISWLQEYCHTGVHSLLFLRLQKHPVQ